MGNDLLRHALKISVDGCCDRLKCGGCVVECNSVEGVVSSCATGVVSVEVGLESLTGINVAGWGMLRFPVFGVGRSCAGLAKVGVCKRVGGGVVVHLSVWIDIALLPPSTLLMIAALCGVGKNWMVHSWWGHGLDAYGSWHSWHVHPSVKTSCAVGVCLWRHCVWTHWRQRSHWMRFGSPESASPRMHMKHCG